MKIFTITILKFSISKGLIPSRISDRTPQTSNKSPLLLGLCTTILVFLLYLFVVVLKLQSGPKFTTEMVYNHYPNTRLLEYRCSESKE